jgi:putative ABC transport system permease protein
MNMITDMRYGLRMMRKHTGFTAVAVLTLALGIGATTAIFSVVYAVVLRPLPFPESERLVAIWKHQPRYGSNHSPLPASVHRDIKAQNTVFEDVAIFRDTGSFNLTGQGEPERLVRSGIAANLFPLLRVKPALGRGFTEDEDEIGHDRVVILSHGLWRRKFAGDPKIIGKTIRIESTPHTVVGVMGPEFQFPTREFQIWYPLTINPRDFQTRSGNYHRAIARLKPGVTVEQAQTEINTIAARLAQQYPESDKGVFYTVTPIRQDVARTARTPLFILLGAVAGLLLIGCANLANLLLARALARSRETAVRSALGATRARLIRQAAVEMLPILALGAITGVIGAQWAIDLMIPWLPAALPRVDEIRISAPVLLFSGGLLFATALLVLIWPAIQATRTDLVRDLREDARTSSGGASKARIRNLLVVGQVALTIILLAGAGLLIRTFSELKTIDPGFRPDGALSLHLAIPREKYKGDAKVASFCQRILEQVRALPGVESAGMVNRLPLGGIPEVWSIELEGTGQILNRLDSVDYRVTTPDYFRTIGIPLIAGRSFTEQDGADKPPVAIIDERIARMFWPNESPIGKRLRAGSGNPWAEIVGVVGHIRHESLDSDPRPQIYWNYLQQARDRMALVVRTAGEPSRLAPSVLRAIHSVDPEQPAYAVRTMSDVLDRSLAMRWFHTVLLSLFAGVSMLLVMLGIYGVVSWTARERTREIGIRMALGAQKRDVLVLVLSHGLKLAAAGIALGLCGAFALTRLLQGQLFGVGPTDPLTFAALPLLIAAVALLACWLPARRAIRVDPMAVLRHE